MNNILSRALKQNTPKINDRFIRGIGKEVFEQIPAFINSMIEISLERVNPNIDLRYLGYKIISPEEELMEDSYSRSSNKAVDIAQNNVRLVRFEFEYNGQPMPKYIYLPYCDPGNMFVVSGTSYIVMPVLTDLVMSVKSDRIFIRLHKDKIHITSARKRIKKNNHPNPDLPRVLYSKIFNSGSKDKMRPNAQTPLGLYILAKFGLYHTIKEYTNLRKNDFYVMYDPKDELFNNPTYKNFDIYSSIGEKPKGYDRRAVYKPHKIKVLIRKDTDRSSLVENLMSGIIMAFDMVNGQIEIDLHDALETQNVKAEIDIWRMLLGRGMYKQDISINKIKEDVTEHIIALDTYIDVILKNRLANGGIYVNDFWDLLLHNIDIYTHAVNNGKEYNRDINKLYFDLFYYICYDIIIGFNRAVKQINQRYQKNGNKSPSKDEIKRIMNNDVRERVIYNLVKSYASSLALAQATTSNDSLYYKGTSMLENQNRGEGVRRGGKTTFPESVRTLSGFMLTFGSLLYLTKTAPTPTLRANLWINIDPKTGKIVIPDHIEPSVKKLDNILRGLTDVSEDIKKEIDQKIETIKESDNV